MFFNKFRNFEHEIDSFAIVFIQNLSLKDLFKISTLELTKHKIAKLSTFPYIVITRLD